MDMMSFSEILVTTYETTQQHDSEDHNPDFHNHGKHEISLAFIIIVLLLIPK
jgi:hypothetical protein